jgi:hypothetical protein
MAAFVFSAPINFTGYHVGTGLPAYAAAIIVTPAFAVCGQYEIEKLKLPNS